MTITTSPAQRTLKEDSLAQDVLDACEKLNSANDQEVLDFSSVRRIYPSALGAMGTLAGAADKQGVKVVLQGVNVDIYKVLKLARLTSRFSFR
jgi:anti-anti-sigma regulatory factor